MFNVNQAVSITLLSIILVSLDVGNLGSLEKQPPRWSSYAGILSQLELLLGSRSSLSRTAILPNFNDSHTAIQ